MRPTVLIVIAASTFPAIAQAGANCLHSQSWQCLNKQDMGTTSTTPANVLPQAGNPSGTITPPLGGIPPDHHNVVLIPPQPPAQRTPQPVAVVTPPQVLPPQKTPVLTPSQPPTQLTPQPMAVVTPPQVLPPQKTPVLAPSQPPAQLTPQPMAVVTPPQILPPQKIPVLQPLQSQYTPVHNPRPQRQEIRPLVIGTGSNQPAGAPHQLVVHEPNRPKPITSGDHDGSRVYSFEFIEPGIQNHKVEVYRSRDAQQIIYKDTIPLDAGGYHLKVIGIRNPDYIN